MAWWGRRRPPRELRPTLAREERIVAWAPVRAAAGGATAGGTTAGGTTAGGTTAGGATAGGATAGGVAAGRAVAGGADAAVVATNLGVFLPGRDARLGWHEIHKATWTGRELIFIPAEVVEERAGYLVTRDGPAVVVTVSDPGDLPEQVRARVTRSVSHSAHERLPGGGGVRIVARRVPGVDGLTWAVRYDAGTDPGAPGVAEATAELVRAGAPLDPAYR